jgi:predicted nucleic acid-binding protein
VTIAEFCRRHQRIGLDTNVLVHLLEDTTLRAAAAQALLDAVEDGRLKAVLASVGLAEVVTGPARTGDGALVERYADELRSMQGLRIEPLSADIAVDAAVIRGTRRIGLPDAIHLATARASGATAFVTNDRSVRSSSKLEVIYLDDLEAPGPG